MASGRASPTSPGYLLKRAQHAFRMRIDTDLRSLGLTAPQYAVLAEVAATPGVSNAELARAAFVTPQSMQGMLSGMERVGLISRIPHPRHGRVLETSLTIEGRQRLEEARERVAEVERLLDAAIGPDIDGLSSALARVAEQLS